MTANSLSLITHHSIAIILTRSLITKLFIRTMSQARIAVVTGASRGIGAGIAITLAAKGADVALVYTSESSTPQAQEVLQQITALGRRAILVRTDLSAADCGTVVRDAVLKGFQTDKIDILVNNAGVTSIQDTLSVDLDEYDRYVLLLRRSKTEAD